MPPTSSSDLSEAYSKTYTLFRRLSNWSWSLLLLFAANVFDFLIFLSLFLASEFFLLSRPRTLRLALDSGGSFKPSSLSLSISLSSNSLLLISSLLPSWPALSLPLFSYSSVFFLMSSRFNLITGVGFSSMIWLIWAPISIFCFFASSIIS